MQKHILVALLLFSLSSACLAKEAATATGEFNSLIEANQKDSKDIHQNLTRSVASDRSAFDGDVIVAHREGTARNPVHYNPFIEEDDVQVKSWRDGK